MPYKNQIKTCLSVAGSDSGGCAGIQADIKTMSACGVFAMTAITSVTSQNTIGVTYVEGLSPVSVETQMEAVLSDIGADGVKSGMLYSKEIIETVGNVIKKYKIEKYVLDPVMVAASGARLLKDDAVNTLKQKLMSLSLLITPNIPEAEALTGVKITTEEDIKNACKILFQMGTKNVLIKGGHMEGAYATDVLFDGSNFHYFSTPRVDTKNIHGSGCSYASAITAYLAQGFDMIKAIQKAKDYIQGAISAGVCFNIGKGNGPLHHFYKGFANE